VASLSWFRRGGVALLMAALLMAACASDSAGAARPETARVSNGNSAFPDTGIGSVGSKPDDPARKRRRSADTFVDYQGKDQGSALPDWVLRYRAGGTAAVEALSGFQDDYVFVAEGAGPDLNALRQWAAGFDIALDFPRLAAVRVQRRLQAACPPDTSPTDIYGRYFESLVRNASNADYPGARRAAECWLAERDPAAGTIWRYLILIRVERRAFSAQIRQLLNTARVSLAPTRSQAAAINRLKRAFFEGF
jgi:hypothetical protein